MHLVNIEAQVKDRQVEPAWNDIFTKLTSFRQSTVILAATELGYFDKIEKQETFSEIAQRLGINDVAASVLIRALVSIGIVEEHLSLYKVRPDIAELFVEGSGYDIRFNILAIKKELEIWSQIAGIMKGEKYRDDSYSRELFDGGIEKFEGLGLLNRLDAEQMIPQVASFIQSGDRVLDIGGGEGYYANRLSLLTELQRVDILDIPTGFSISKRVNKDYLTQNRVNHIQGDARSFTAAPPYDVVLMNELTELFNKTDKHLILDNAVANLKPNGLLIMTKFPLNTKGTGPGRFPLFSVRMLMKFEDAYLETDQELAEWVQNRNLQLVYASEQNRTLMVFKNLRTENSL